MPKVDRKKLIELYTYLLKARMLEKKLIEVFSSGVASGWIHSELGQEAVGVGVAYNLRPDDYITYNHRARSILLPRAVDLRRFMAETLCRKDGQCMGRTGELLFRDIQHGVLFSSLCLGNSIPFAAGVAFACSYKGTDQVTVALFGDGTVDTGSFHEALNIASLWKLPVVFVCVNNGFAQFTPQELTASVVDISKKASAYNMPGMTVDGTDVLAISEAAEDFVAIARTGKGPSLLECKVPRWEGHFYGDPQRYRDPKEKEESRKNDSLAKYESKLLGEGILTPKAKDRIEKEFQAELAEALEFAIKDPYPPAEDYITHVYC